MYLFAVVVFPAKFKDNYLKELLLATILFCLPLLISIHALFSEDSVTNFTLFGLKFENAHGSDMGLVWCLLLIAIPLIFTILFFSNTSSALKPFLLLLIWWLTYEFLCEFINQIENIQSQRRLTSGILATILVFNLSNFRLSFCLYKEKNPFIKFRRREGFFLFAVIMTFLLFLLYRFVGTTIQELDLVFLKISNFGFSNVSVFIWVMGYKLGLSFIVFMWYLMERKWWKYALLSPILLTFYQMKTILSGSSDLDVLDEHEIFESSPFLLLVALVLIALSKNAKDQYVAQLVYQKTSSRIERLLEQRNQEHVNAISDTKRRLTDLKEQKTTVAINDLMEIKKQLEHELGERA